MVMLNGCGLLAVVAQVEGLLQGVGRNSAAPADAADAADAVAEGLDDDFMYGDVSMDDEDGMPTYPDFTHSNSTGPGPSPGAGPGLGSGLDPGSGAIMWLGMSESLPPPAVIEDLYVSLPTPRAHAATPFPVIDHHTPVITSTSKNTTPTPPSSIRPVISAPSTRRRT